MSNPSQISNQAKQVQRIVLPSGVGLISNSSPSLLPINGSMATDVGLGGSLLVSDGTNWNTMVQGGPGGTTINNTSVSNITLTSGAGNPNLTNCTLKLQKITTPNNTLVYFDLEVDQSITTTTYPDVWAAPANTVPVGFRSTTAKLFPASVTESNSFTPIANASVAINVNTNSIQVQVTTGTAGTGTTFFCYSGIYSI